jgi:hypothetical protein
MLSNGKDAAPFEGMGPAFTNGVHFSRYARKYRVFGVDPAPGLDSLFDRHNANRLAGFCNLDITRGDVLIFLDEIDCRLFVDGQNPIGKGCLRSEAHIRYMKVANF